MIIKRNKANVMYKGNTEVAKVYKGKELVYINTFGVRCIGSENGNCPFIDTGFKANQDTRIVCEYMIDYSLSINETLSPLFGSDVSYNSNNFTAWLRYFGSGGNVDSIGYGGQQIYGNGYGMTEITPLNTKMKLDANKNVWTNTNTETNEVLWNKTFSYRSFTTPNNIAVFRYLRGSTTTYPTSSTSWFNGVVYSFKIYDNGVLVRDLVPRIQDSQVGFIDKCGSICQKTGTSFYVNANTSGSFEVAR